MSTGTRLVSIICCVGVVVVTGCTTDKNSVVAPEPQQFDFSSGEDHGKHIYLGLTLGDNDVGALFPELWGDGHAGTIAAQGSAEAAAVAELKEILLARVPAETGDPSFFCNYSNAMRSGDHVLIDQYFTLSTTATKNAMERLSQEQQAAYAAHREAGGDPEAGFLKSGAWYIGDDDYYIDNGQAAAGLGKVRVWRKYVAIYHALALNNVAAVHAALAINVHIAINVDKYINRTRGPGTPEETYGAGPGPFELQRAAWIDMVATRLYGPPRLC